MEVKVWSECHIRKPCQLFLYSAEKLDMVEAVCQTLRTPSSIKSEMERKSFKRECKHVHQLIHSESRTTMLAMELQMKTSTASSHLEGEP